MATEKSGDLTCMLLLCAPAAAEAEASRCSPIAPQFPPSPSGAATEIEGASLPPRGTKEPLAAGSLRQWVEDAGCETLTTIDELPRGLSSPSLLAALRRRLSPFAPSRFREYFVFVCLPTPAIDKELGDGVLKRMFLE